MCINTDKMGSIILFLFVRYYILFYIYIVYMFQMYYITKIQY